jgi:hypothetical protein
VACNSDAADTLERERDYRDATFGTNISLLFHVVVVVVVVCIACERENQRKSLSTICIEYIEAALRRQCLAWGAALCYASSSTGANITQLRALLRYELLAAAG